MQPSCPPDSVSLRVLIKECDFEGCRRRPGKWTTAPVATEGTAESEGHVVLGGLEGSYPYLQSLTASVRFQIDAVHGVETAMSPMQARLSHDLDKSGSVIFIWRVVGQWCTHDDLHYLDHHAAGWGPYDGCYVGYVFLGWIGTSRILQNVS